LTQPEFAKQPGKPGIKMSKKITRILFSHFVLVFVFPMLIMFISNVCDNLFGDLSVYLFYLYLGMALLTPLSLLVSAISHPERFRFYALIADTAISIFQLLFIVMPLIS
jgi:hypothetical protein